MDKFNRNAWGFMGIFGVLIIMGIFNSGMYFKQLKYNEIKLAEVQSHIQSLHR